ncbi:MAG: hypothetical protein JXR37_23290 [Kiritimatiellae bacterium]|nr:hypothetical protein [Kiritimatiellia bacterium]
MRGIRLCMLLLGLAASGYGAEEDFSLDLFRPRVSIGFEATSGSRLREQEGETLTARAARLEALVPLGGTHISPAAFVLGTQRLHERLRLIHGGAYTHRYGEALGMPLLGVYWKMGQAWRLMAAVPFYTRVTYGPASKCKLHFLARAAGNWYGFCNDDEFPGHPERVLWRESGARAGAELEYALNANLAFSLQARASGLRRLAFSEGADEFVTSEIEPGGYAEVVVRYTFGRSLLDRFRP